VRAVTRELGELRKFSALLKAANLLVIDDLFLHKLPPAPAMSSPMCS
jgi:hypothetical protein